MGTCPGTDVSKPLTIALTKGRILKETLPLLARAGIEPLEDIGKSRKLVFDTSREGIQLVIIRGTDVPTYVRHGAAELGVVHDSVRHHEFRRSDTESAADFSICRHTRIHAWVEASGR